MLEILLARKKAKLTQDEVAQLIGVHRTLYSKIENGKQMPKADVAAKILDLFQLDYGIFLPCNVQEMHNEERG